MPDALERCLIEELTTPADPDVAAFAERLARLQPVPPLGIFFYGSVLRQTGGEGILDFYIVTENTRGFAGNFFARWANRILPPNVRYVEHQTKDRVLRAKIATLSYRQFLRRTSLETLDTTLWARFCQPVRLLWVRDPKAADRLLELLRRCVITASCWAALLGPEKGSPVAYWDALFARTYDAELRVERKGRGRSLIEGQEERFGTCLLEGWKAARLSFSCGKDGAVAPWLTETARRKAALRWQHVRRSGKPRNILRLLKAAFTFQNGTAYLAWKITRHTGVDIQLSAFEKRHPLLTLPLFLWRARRLASR